MEGVAAFALACNVVQVVELSIKVAGIIQQTYSQGRSDDNATTQDISERLNTLSQTLNQSLTVDARQGSPTIAELQLQQIAPECSKIALELGRELDLLKARAGKRDAVWKGIRAMRKKGYIEKQKAKLQDYERILNTGLLVNLREQNNAALVLQQDNFETLSQTIQNFIKNVAAGRSRTEDVLRSEHALTRQLLNEEGRKIERNLGAQINNLSKVHLDGDRYDNLLKSLEYPEMNWRPSQIGDAGFKTFEWVFDDILPNPYYRKERPWDSFSNWLTSGTGIYWVQGKPGSGKSTLMKHLWQHDTTRELLKNWCSTKKLVVVSFGFWLSGSPMQRSLKGFLCSLLYQVLYEHQESLPGFVEPTSKLFVGKKSPQDWSLGELSTFLEKTVHRLAETSAFCFFLDGLDEIDKNEDPRKLVSLVNSLISEVDVKACVSSRPEQLYCDEFRSAPSLRLQDLTEVDIRTFTMEQLSDVQTAGWLGEPESDIRNSIIDEIVTKAAGVFLWVRLALRDVLRGRTARASWKELRVRISRLPADIERLYEDIINRNAEDWYLVKEEAALYFTSFLLGDRYFDDLETFAIIASKWQQGWSDWRPNFSIEELRKVCYHTMLRIQIVCGGMLEVTEHDEVVEPGTEPDNSVEFPFQGRRVRLFHRTVRDFLVDNPAGQAILGCSTIAEKDLFHAMMEAHLFVRTRRVYQTRWTHIAQLLRDIDHFHRLNSYISDDEVVANLNQVKQYLPQIAHAALAQQFDLPHDIDHSAVESNRSCEYQLATYSIHADFRPSAAVSEDFMGLTLQVGIPTYLESFLRTYSHTQPQMPKIHQQYKNYLLLCACYGYAKNNRYDAAITINNLPVYDPARIRKMEQVMVQLLNIGADPNAKLFLHPSLPTMTTPGSILLWTKKQRMMTTHFCELFWHFLEKGFRLEDPEFVYYTFRYGWVPMAELRRRSPRYLELSGLFFQATRRYQLGSIWDAMVQICPELTLFDRCEAEPDKPDMDVVFVRCCYFKDHHDVRRTVKPTSDQSKQVLLVVDMLEQLDADQAISDDDRYEKRSNLCSLLDQQLQEVVESSKEEVSAGNSLAEKGLPMACSDPVTLPGPIPMYENDSDNAMTSDGIAKYCEVCREQRKELLKYRWTPNHTMEKKPLELLISQGLDVRKNDMVSSPDESSSDEI